MTAAKVAAIHYLKPGAHCSSAIHKSLWRNMMKGLLRVCRTILTAFLGFSATCFAGVTVSVPATGASVGTSVHFVASSTSSCARGISAMGIYTAPFQLAYVVNGAKLDTTLNLAPGTYNTVVQEWDNCNSFAKQPITITVSGSSSGAL